jgi:hypothetical protein
MGGGRGEGGPPSRAGPPPPVCGLVLAARDGGRGAAVSPASAAVWPCAPPLVYGVQGRTPPPR